MTASNKETKKRVAAVSALFALATLICTIILVFIEHPAQWYVGGACMVGMIVTFVFMTSIDC